MPRLEGERRGGTGVDGGLTGRDVWLTDGDDDAPALGADDAEPLVVPDAAPEDPEEAALDAAEELDGAEELTIADELLGALVLLLPCTALPIVPSCVQSEDDGAGCAGGVTGSPWWNVEVPYTPIGWCIYRQRVMTERE